MRLSLRTVLELVGVVTLAGLLVWQVIKTERLRTDLADQVALTSGETLKVQAAEASNASCQAALDQVRAATDALTGATEDAYAQAAGITQDAAYANQLLVKRIQDLLAIRPAPGNDCEAAMNLSEGSWSNNDE